MKLNDLREHPGATKARKRVGRGIGSGSGGTSGRGHKGQKARSGVAIKGFEGGQMPLHRRLPKRGFKKPNAKHFNVVNLGRVQAAIDAKKLDPKKSIDMDALVAAGLVTARRDGVRLLATGEIKAKASFVVDGVSKAAAAAIEKAGGTLNIRRPKVLEADEAKRAKTAAKKRPQAAAKSNAPGTND
jgi:large subunit ribosomal protein L15